MELGCDGVLMNTAIAAARNPVLMASAMRKAIEAGREAYLAGLGRQQDRAEASSPLTGFLGDKPQRHEDTKSRHGSGSGSAAADPLPAPLVTSSCLCVFVVATVRWVRGSCVPLPLRADR